MGSCPDTDIDPRTGWGRKYEGRIIKIHMFIPLLLLLLLLLIIIIIIIIIITGSSSSSSSSISSSNSSNSSKIIIPSVWTAVVVDCIDLFI